MISKLLKLVNLIKNLKKTHVNICCVIVIISIITKSKKILNIKLNSEQKGPKLMSDYIS